MFVAVYGLEFKEAGQKTHTLFRRLGWTAIVNDDLIQVSHVVGPLGHSLVRWVRPLRPSVVVSIRHSNIR